MGLTPTFTEAVAARLARGFITIVVIAALCWPAIRNSDSFPLSTYPMYATSRADTTVFTIANGLDEVGERGPLTLSIIGASDDPLIVAGELGAVVRRGEAAVRCREIADRAAVARDDGQIDSRIITVEIASERHRTSEAALGDPSLEERTVHASCPVRIGR